MMPRTGRLTLAAMAAESWATLVRRSRGGHDNDLAARQVLAEAEGDVPGTGRHVDQQEVGIVPEHVGQELLEGLVQHRTAPDHCLTFGDEVADGNAAHAVALRWNQHLVDDDGSRSAPNMCGML